MKNVVIVLSILAALLLAALFLRGKSAQRELAAAQARVLAHSNEIIELKVKLTSKVAASIELMEGLSNRIAEVVSFSNRLAQAHAGLEKGRADLAAAQQALARCHEQARAGEAQREALVQRQAELSASLAALQTELAQARSNAQAAAEQCAALQAELNQARSEKLEWARRFGDPAALQAQLTSLKEQERRPRRPSATGPTGSDRAKAKDLKLVLQPDGTVTWNEAAPPSSE